MRVTGEEAQGTMGRVKNGGEVILPSFLCAQIFIEREVSGYEAKSLVRLQAYLQSSKSLILKPYTT